MSPPINNEPAPRTPTPPGTPVDSFMHNLSLSEPDRISSPQQRFQDEFDFEDFDNESVSTADLDYLAGAYRPEVLLTKRILTFFNQIKPYPTQTNPT